MYETTRCSNCSHWGECNGAALEDECPFSRARGMTIDQVRDNLLKVGDKLMRCPVPRKSNDGGERTPKPCTVVYVNREKLWYLCQFENGTRVAFKLPEVEE